MLKSNIDNLDGVDEKFHSLYTEKDGKFVLTGVEIEDVAGLKGSLKKERDANEQLQKDVKALKSGQDELKKLKMKQAEDGGDFESIKKQMNDAHAEEKSTWESEKSGYKSQLTDLKINNTAMDAISKERGNTELLMPYIKNRTRMNDDGTVQVLDGKGQPMVNDQGENLGITDLVKELKSDNSFAGAFEGTGHSGGGMPSGDAAGGGKEKSGNDKIKSGLETMRAG